jgi:DNA-binding NarL/FixJ family response regulator
MPSPQFTVAIVEDHPEFRDALSHALGACHQIELLPICKDLPAGLRLLEQVCPDVLLIDLGLPSGSGLSLIREAQRRWGARCASAVLTVAGNEEHLFTAVCAGAKGYLYKSDQPAQWLESVQALSTGESPIHPNMARYFVQQDVAFAPESRTLLQHIAAGYTLEEAQIKLQFGLKDAGERIRAVYDLFMQLSPKLSDREMELLQYLNKGIPFKQCAEMMGVAEATTKTLAGRAYQKLGASNLQSALYEARVANLLA